MKFKYVPGIRPTPMLMYQKDLNKEVFNSDEKAYKKGDYSSKFNHIWNIGAYFIYDNNLKIISYRISNFHNFLWLLRIINEEIVIEFEEDFIKENKSFIEEVSEELIKM